MTTIVELDVQQRRHYAPAKWEDEGIHVDDLEDRGWEDSSTDLSMDGEDR